MGMPEGFAHPTIFTPPRLAAVPPTSSLSLPPSPMAAASAPAMVPCGPLTAQHVVVGVVSDGVDVRGGLGAPLPLVGRHHGCGVDGQPLVGVDGDAEEPRVGLRAGRGRLRRRGAPAPLPLMAGRGWQGPPRWRWLT